MDEVCNGLTALNGGPRRDPVRWWKRVVLEMADGRGVEQDIRSEQSRCPRGFRKPLVIADQHAEFQVSGLEYLVAEIAGLKVTLLVEKRIVRDMNFSIGVEQRSVH